MAVGVERTISLQVGSAILGGTLGVPNDARGVVLFAHGSGSSRFSPRNRYVADVLRAGGIGTLLLDLLEEWESDDRQKVFDIGLLAERLIGATARLQHEPETEGLAIGYFGASTGAGAALQAAAKLGDQIKAVVSRGGRPDLAMEYLPDVTASTLLIVGELDGQVISMNKDAYDRMRGVREMVIVPGATHLFEEPGTLERVAELARDWFTRYLVTDAE